MLDSAYYEKSDEILDRYPREERSLIPVIHDVQAEYRYLPLELLPYIAKQIRITETKTYNKEGSEIDVDFDSETGMAKFAKVPAGVLYWYDIGFNNVSMDVAIVAADNGDDDDDEPSKPGKSGGSHQWCDMWLGSLAVLSLAALVALKGRR